MTTPSSLDHAACSHFEPMPPDHAFLNAAYMSPEPITALRQLHATVDRMARPSFTPDEFFAPLERVRDLLARVVGGEPGAFSLNDSVSYGASLVAWNLRLDASRIVGERRTILGVDGQFPSNVYPWRALEPFGFRLVLVDGGAGATDRLLEHLDENTALVAVEPLSWTDGRRLDVPRLVASARDAGALTLFDVTQSAGADAPIADDVPIDVVIGAGYKWLLGPYGTGFVRLSPRLQEILDPLEWNWKNFEGSSDFNRLTEYASEFASPAIKFDHGESSAFLRLPAWEAGLALLDELGPASIGAHGAAFARVLAESLDADRFSISAPAGAEQAGHLFRVEPRDPRDFDPLSERLLERGVFVSRRAGGWRISPHVYNGGAHAARFLESFD